MSDVGTPHASVRVPRSRPGLVVGLVLIVCALVAPAARAALPPPPSEDPFYAYDGSKPLESIAPGTVLKTRTLAYHVAGLPVPVKAVQLLYRSTGVTGEATTNVTSVLKPPHAADPPTIVAYQSFYDSLNPADEPSYAIAGGLTLGGIIPNIEALLIAPELAKGHSVVVADTEGQSADFAAGLEYGMNTLDSLRAAVRSPATGLAETAEIGLIGYSGGAIATEWAAELAPSYAPGIDRRLVGATFGGVLVHPAHNLHYVDGSKVWAGVIPMALIGVSRAFDIDLTPYMSPYGLRLYDKLQDASIIQVLGQYPGLTWAQMAKPQYATPESVPLYVEVVNQLIMGTGGTPTVPLQIAQGAHGELEGTSGDQPGIGDGDGVMIAGDVRTLARKYCRRGVEVQYDQYDKLGHIATALMWLGTALPWLSDRFAGRPAPENCAEIPPGNPLAPIEPAP